MKNTIENRATGERITFIRRAIDTRGAFTESILRLPSGSRGPALHVHPMQEEYLEAIEGPLGLTVGKRSIILRPGQSFTVPAGIPHRLFALRGQNATCRIIWKPSLHIEYLLEEFFDSANRRNGSDPSMLEAAYVLHQLRGEFYLAGGIPAWLQQLAFAAFALLGKSFGFVKSSKCIENQFIK
ncbi:MAG TPA: cupin domain-containing protein [Saprospiraceae bacterium]|nr:cupin domain-containing protein [Saprospiraceae bacterium]